MKMALPPTYVEGFHDLDEVKRMTYVDLGKTGLKVSRLGFGTAGFGNEIYGFNEYHEKSKALHEALKRGINYIDTAPYYGEKVAEEILGELLKDIPRSAYYMATKVGRYSAKVEKAFDFSRKAVLKSVDDSLKRLGLDYVDIIQVHDLEFAPSADIIIEETLPALEEVVRSGKARFIGVTGYPLSKLWEVIDKSRTKIDMVLTYARLTLMDDALVDYIPKFQSKNVAVLHASPTGLQILTNRGSQPWHPANPLYKAICDKAGQYCKENGVELGRLAVYYTLLQPGIDVHVIGMPNLDLVKSNMDVLLNGISEKEKNVLQEIFKRFFTPDGRKNWENIEVSKYREALLSMK